MRPPLCMMLLLLATLAPASGVRGDEPLVPDEGLLLLDGGQVLRGAISRAGDYYCVALAEGEIHVKAASVELVCRTLDEVYQRKAGKIAQGTALDHLNLAQWCLQQGLLGYAAEEVSAAIKLDPQQPRIPLLERRLELARSQQEQAEKQPATASREPSSDDLDRMVRGMPPGTVDSFAHTIQPLLLNHCSSAGCHGPDSTTGYSLRRIPLGRTPSRRLTQRNLFATFEHINPNDPALSALLQQAIREHGSAKTPVFTSHDAAQYRQLLIWVYRVSRSAPPAQVESVAASASPLLQALPGKDMPANPSAPPRSQAPGAKSNQRQPNQTEPQPKSTEPPKLQGRGAAAASAADPLDPAAFNERYAPK